MKNKKVEISIDSVLVNYLGKKKPKDISYKKILVELEDLNGSVKISLIIKSLDSEPLFETIKKGHFDEIIRRLEGVRCLTISPSTKMMETIGEFHVFEEIRSDSLISMGVI